jgi:hypothetical protein
LCFRVGPITESSEDVTDLRLPAIGLRSLGLVRLVEPVVIAKHKTLYTTVVKARKQ